MRRLLTGFRLGMWLIPVVLAGALAGVFIRPQQAAEAKPLGAVREYDVTFKAPDLMVPNVFAVSVGDTIRFRIKNEGPAPHNLHIGGNGVDVESPRWVTGDTAVWEYTFTRPGVYSVYCSITGRSPSDPTHRMNGPMEGVIVVTEAGAAPPDLSRWQTRAIPLSGVAGSSIAGAAYIQPRSDQSVSIRVQATGVTPGASYFFNFRMNSSDCLGGSADRPSVAVRATGTTVNLFQTKGGALGNAFSVALEEGTAAPATIRACGDSSRAVTGAGNAPVGAAPAALPKTGDSADLRGFLLAGIVIGILGLGLSVLRRRGTAAA